MGQSATFYGMLLRARRNSYYKKLKLVDVLVDNNVRARMFNVLNHVINVLAVDTFGGQPNIWFDDEFMIRKYTHH